MLAALAFFAQAQQPDQKFMQMAVYRASSPIEDPTAAGGFGTADNLPQLVDRSMLGKGLKATVQRIKDGFVVTVTNGSEPDAWIDAADSNVFGWLEAKDKNGEWKAIEFKPWYTCGNSYHRVNLPVGYGWSWKSTIPNGDFKTQVRWRFDQGRKASYSNVIDANIPITRFALAPEVAQNNRLETKYGYPMLMPIF